MVNSAGSVRFALRIGRVGLGVGPLHDVVVLDADDREPVEVVLAHQCLDVGGVAGRKEPVRAR